MCYMANVEPGATYASRDEHAAGPGRDPRGGRVGVRELRQNLSVYLRRVAAGETLEVTEHGRPVARLGPLPSRRLGVLDRLVEEGRAIPADTDLAEIGMPPQLTDGPTLSEVLATMREEDEEEETR